MNSTKQKTSSWIKIISINIVLIGIIIVVAELIWGGWLDKSSGMQAKDCRYVLCSADIEFESKFSGKTKYTKDGFGLRGRKSLDSDIDLVVVGGSTSDQRYVNDNQTWDYLLELEFANSGKSVEIVNAGIDGQTTYGNIWNFIKWFPFIPDFSPKYVLFYLGINDSSPIDNHGQYDNINTSNDLASAIKGKIHDNSVFYEVYKTIKGILLSGKIDVDHSTDRAKLPYGIEFNKIDNDWDSYKQDYVQEQFVPRLKELARLTRNLGAEPIFVTQRSAGWIVRAGRIVGAGYPSDTGSFYKYKGKTYVFSTADAGYAQSIISNSIMQYCEESGFLCIDGFSEFSIDKTTTYDLVHTNAHGSIEIAKKIFAHLDTMLQLDN